MSVSIVASKVIVYGSDANERILNARKEILGIFRDIVEGLGLIRVDANGDHSGWSTNNSIFPYGYVYECFTFPRYESSPEDAPFYLTLTMRSRAWTGDYLCDINMGITTTLCSDGVASYPMTPSLYDGFYYKTLELGGVQVLEYSKRYATLATTGGARFYRTANRGTPATVENVSTWTWGTLPVRVDPDASGGSVQLLRWGGNKEIEVFCDDGTVRRLTYGLTDYYSSNAIKGGDQILTMPLYLTSVRGESYSKAQIEVPEEALRGFLPNADFSSANAGALIGPYMTVDNIAMPY